MVCEGLNSTVPFLKTKEQNYFYRNAFDSMNITRAVAVESPLGLIELEKNGMWNLTPSNSTVDVICERNIELTKHDDKKIEGNRI